MRCTEHFGRTEGDVIENPMLMFSNPYVQRGHAIVSGNRISVHPDDYEMGKEDPEHLGSLTVITIPDLDPPELFFDPSPVRSRT